MAEESRNERVEVFLSSVPKKTVIELERIQLSVFKGNLLGFNLLLIFLRNICKRKRKSILNSLLSTLGLLINSDALMLSLMDFEAVDLGTRGNCIW